MNLCIVSGTLASEPEPRRISSGRLLLNFDIYLDALDTCLHCAYFPDDGGAVNFKAGDYVLVTGELRLRRAHTLFLAVRQILAVPRDLAIERAQIEQRI